MLVYKEENAGKRFNLSKATEGLGAGVLDAYFDPTTRRVLRLKKGT